MAIDLKLIKLLGDYKNPEDIMGENGLLKLERAMQAELTEHLGYEKHDPADTRVETHATAERPRR
jgi:putative transposase